MIVWSECKWEIDKIAFNWDSIRMIEEELIFLRMLRFEMISSRLWQSVLNLVRQLLMRSCETQWLDLNLLKWDDVSLIREW